MRLIGNYDSAADLKSVLTENGFNMSKKFGQNFMISPGARKRLLETLDADPADSVWEIGPGLGALTHSLVDIVSDLTVFEIDRGFVKYLDTAFKNRIKIVEGDFVKTWKKTAHEEGFPERIIGNLPYNSASAIISSLIENRKVPHCMVVTVQKEMGARMSASCGTKNYSSFSMLCQYAFRVENMGDLRPGAFYPSPDVVSSVLRLTPHHLYDENGSGIYFKFIRDLFLSRRKKIRNNLSRGALSSDMGWEYMEPLLVSCGINPDDRGENVSVEQAAVFSMKMARAIM